LTDARDVVLFDVNSLDVAVSGGDYLQGEDGDDVLFGQGNGAQAPTQGDPLDGYDNDLDGRESGGSAEYDCEDAFDNDGVEGIDAADAGCSAAVDEDAPWLGDLILGDAGTDYAEGNHGADWMFGGADQDDLIGGGSALDGVIDADRSGVGLHDWADVIHGNEGHDVITGDNATINKAPVAGAWSLIANGGGSAFPILQRAVSMATTPELAGNFGNDHLLGDADHDQLYGQQGHDLIEGNAGDDGMIGDLGRFVTSVENGTRAAPIKPKSPFIEDDIFAAGTLTHLTTLFSQQTGQGAEGDDIILGGQGHDDVHAGPGHDVVNGDRYAPPDAPNPELKLQDAAPTDFVWDDPDDPASITPWADEDALFGGWGNDIMWGGRGPDHLYGGHGNDSLDVRPRPETSPYPRDTPRWFNWTTVAGGVEEHNQDYDTVYGGWGADVMQANLAGNGPQNGDRLFDWVGAYNLYYICASTYGDWVATRAIEPGVLGYFEQLASGDGLEATATPGSSGYLELGLVYTKDVKQNANPPHPETPGHFYCGAGEDGP
jgi:Ca2+-binding RTX toxin-like protein